MAVMPGGFDDLRKICTDVQALELLGGKGKAFAAQMEWLSAAVRAFPSEPALAPLARYVEQSLRERYEAFENGLAGLDALEQGLRFSELSQAAYPSQPEQVRLRKALADRKAWFDRKVAVLKAFAGSEQWDPLLLASRDLEVYEQAFPEMAKYRGEALKQSLQLHRKAGHDRLTEVNTQRPTGNIAWPACGNPVTPCWWRRCARPGRSTLGGWRSTGRTSVSI